MSKVIKFVSEKGHLSKIDLLYFYGYSYFLETYKKSEIVNMYDLAKSKKYNDLASLIVDLFFLSSDESSISKDFLEISKDSNLYKDCEGKYKSKIREIQKKKIAENPYNERVESKIIEFNNLEERLNKIRQEIMGISSDKLSCPYAKQMHGEFLQRSMEND